MATLGSTVVLFGGYDQGSGTTFNDTWTFNGSTWTQVGPPSSPSARTSPAMGTMGDLVVLFGGADAAGQYLRDTWTFNGSDWTQVTVASHPN